MQQHLLKKSGFLSGLCNISFEGKTSEHLDIRGWREVGELEDRKVRDLRTPSKKATHHQPPPIQKYDRERHSCNHQPGAKLP